ncbi:MAG: NAD(P)/FAD-dependent oxidoreductase, partial [Candidatus Thorarchaeota archaeon]
VGAGPAGSTAARYLAAQGYKVALIDKEEFPRDKPCGGGFSYEILNDFPYLKKKETQFLQGICKNGILHSPNRKIALRGRVDMAVALRIDFDNALFESALEEGAISLAGKRAKSVTVDSNKATLELQGGESIHAKAVLGADGVGSLIARQLGLHYRWPSSAVSACRVVEIPEKQSFIEEVYSTDKDYHFYANLGGMPGYGWIFPKRSTINVGLGIIGTHSQGLPRRFDSFIKMLKDDGLLPADPDLRNVRGAIVPTGGTVKQTYVDRCLLVGDSAGMVSPLTGGGIHYAMRAARIASYVLSEALESDRMTCDSLARFQMLWYEDFGKDIGPMLRAQKLFTGAFTGVLFEIGSRDEEIQKMVSEAMAESSDEGINARKLIVQTLRVILREAFHL